MMVAEYEDDDQNLIFDNESVSYETLRIEIRKLFYQYNDKSLQQQVHCYQAAIALVKEKTRSLVADMTDFEIAVEYVFKDNSNRFPYPLLAAMDEVGISAFDSKQNSARSSVHQLIEYLCYEGTDLAKELDFDLEENNDIKPIQPDDCSSFLAKLKRHANDKDQFGLTPAQRLAVKLNGSHRDVRQEGIERLIEIGVDIFEAGNATSFYDALSRHAVRISSNSGESVNVFLDMERRRYFANLAAEQNNSANIEKPRSPRL